MRQNEKQDRGNRWMPEQLEPIRKPHRPTTKGHQCGRGGLPQRAQRIVGRGNTVTSELFDAIALVSQQFSRKTVWTSAWAQPTPMARSKTPQRLCASARGLSRLKATRLRWGWFVDGKRQNLSVDSVPSVAKWPPPPSSDGDCRLYAFPPAWYGGRAWTPLGTNSFASSIANSGANLRSGFRAVDMNAQPIHN